MEIKNRYTGEVIYQGKADSIKELVERAVKEGANLGYANLGGVYLGDSDLRGGYFEGAYLRYAYLGGVDFEGAYLKDADLKGAYLSYAKGIIHVSGSIPFDVYLTKNYVIVRCQYHKWEEWRNFKEVDFDSMELGLSQYRDQLYKLMDLFESNIRGK